MKEGTLFKDLKIDHLAFLCADLKTSNYLNFYRKLSWEVFHSEDLYTEGVSLQLLKSKQENFYIELIAPSSPDSTLTNALESRGEGFHHICYQVDNLEKFLIQLKANSIKILPNYPRLGSRGKQICFLDPKDTGKILVELAEITN